MNIDTQSSSILTSVTPTATQLQTSVSETKPGFVDYLNQAASNQATSNKLTSNKAMAQSDKKLKAACKDMEAVFLNMMLTTMRSTVPKDSLLGDNNGEDIMKSMLDQELSKNMAQAGGIGLADLMYRQLSSNQQAGIKK